VLEGNFHLLVGRSIQDLATMEARMLRTGLWIGAVTVLLALGGGSVLSRGLRKRMESINRISREIMRGSLSRRIPAGGSGDDLDQLIGNLNAMLDRIEVLMEDMRRMTHNIAHDLRTPLTRLRVRLEALHAEPLEADRRRVLAEEALAEADRLLATFNALLRIAEIDSGKRRAGFRDLSLGEILTDVVELYEPLAEEKAQRIALDCRDHDKVRGDRDLLFQAFANVLDNAVKYAPEHGRIHIATASPEGRIEVRISDDGPGVPPEAREAVLERFVRLDDSRSQPGSGLGLSLVAAVARLHDASVRLLDNEPGLAVVLSFPPASEPLADPKGL
jgi:signal transduction histidine kinase